MQPLYKNKGLITPFRLQLLADLVLITFSFIFAHYSVTGHAPTLIEHDPYSLLLLYINFVWFAQTLIFPIYVPQRKNSIIKTSLMFVKHASYYICIISLSIVLFRWHFVSRELLVIFMGSFLVVGVFFRALWRYYSLNIRSKGKELKNVVIVGTGELGAIIENKITAHPEFGYNISGFLMNGSLDLQIARKDKVIGKISEIESILTQNEIDEVVIALGYNDYEETKKIISYCERKTIRTWIVPDFFAKTGRNAILDDFDGVPILRIREEPLESSFNRFVKRTFDIFLALSIFLTLFPLLCLLLKILNYFYSPGPLFYKQKRHGVKNEIFECLKFRSMKYEVNASGSDEFKQAVKEDPRVTIVGRFIRRTNIDEIPQIINVLKGEMSIVGPRPHPIELNNHWNDLIQQFMVRHFVQPGLTGWAQVNGYRGETETFEKMSKRVEYDIWYIENWSFSTDLKIILKTIVKMIVGDKAAY